MSNSVNNAGISPQRWSAIFDEFEKDYKDAYYSIDKAVKLDEEGKLTEALAFYEFGLNLIDKALDLTETEPSEPDFSLEKAVVMAQKMRKTRKEILLRIEAAKSKPQPEETELPPSYEEVIANSKPDSIGTGDTNGNISNNFQLPGPSNTELPYIPQSAMPDEKLLANLRTNEGSSNALVTYSDLSHQLKEMNLANNEEILFRCDNVQLYFISPDGRVSSTSHPSAMIIARVYDTTSLILDEALNNVVNDLYKETHESKKKRHRHSLLHKKHHHHHHKSRKHKWRKDETADPAIRTFLQVDSWIYPLIPKVSFSLRNSSGAFILPDINSNIKGAAVGLIVPDEVGDKVHELFTELLNEPSSDEKSRKSVAKDFAPGSNSSKFLKGTAYVAHYLVKGASTAAQFLDSSTPKIIDKISPQPEPQPINPAIQKTVEVAKAVTESAVNVTDYLATKVCSATMSLGRFLSPYVQKQGSQLLAYTTNSSEEEALKKINSLINATSNTVEGIANVYSGLEAASSILSRSLANNTVQIIEYKYGQAAGALTNDAIATVGNVYYTRYNFKYLKPKGIFKSTLKGTGQAILDDYKKSEMSLKPHHEFPGDGPGSGSGIPPST